MPVTLDEHPNLLLFDGVCNLCNHTVQFVLERDRQGLVHFGSIQSETGSRLYREHGYDPEHPDSMLLLTPKGAFRESDAAMEIARLLGGWWKLLTVLKILPRWLRNAAYRSVARNRYRLFGKKDRCMMPRPEWKQRFLPG